MKYLIEGAENWWRLWSVRLAALAGVVTAYLAANPEQSQELLALLPDGPWRVVASIAIGLFVFATTTGVRLASQKNLDAE